MNPVQSRYNLRFRHGRPRKDIARDLESLNCGPASEEWNGHREGGGGVEQDKLNNEIKVFKECFRKEITPLRILKA